MVYVLLHVHMFVMWLYVKFHPSLTSKFHNDTKTYCAGIRYPISTATRKLIKIRHMWYVCTSVNMYIFIVKLKFVIYFKILPRLKFQSWRLIKC